MLSRVCGGRPLALQLVFGCVLPGMPLRNVRIGSGFDSRTDFEIPMRTNVTVRGGYGESFWVRQAVRLSESLPGVDGLF